MRILVTDGLAPEAVEWLQEQGHEVDLDEVDAAGLLEKIGDYEGLIVRSRTKVPREAFGKAVKLMVIGRAGIGTDNIDKEAAVEHKVSVVNAPSGSTVSVAEYTMGMMLAVSRHIPRGDAGLHQGKWLKKQLKGVELMGKTLGLIGSGRIGAEVARRAGAFGMNVIAYDPYVRPEVCREFGFGLVDNLDDLLERSDYVSVHCVLNDETRGMLGAGQFKRMKNTAHVINCARGPVIDEGALANALKSGEIAGAALDVYENEPLDASPLMELDNVVLMPHVGASTAEAQLKAGMITAEQVHKVLTKQEPDHRVC